MQIRSTMLSPNPSCPELSRAATPTRTGTQSGDMMSLLATGLLALLMASCAPREAADHDHEAEPPADSLAEQGTLHEELEIPVTAQQNTGMNIIIAAIQDHPISLHVTGIVTPVPSKVVHLRPLAEGVIKQVDVILGDRVRAGQPLVHYDNVALGDHIGQYRQAKASLEVRRISFDRAQRLIELEAIAQQALDMRRSEFEQAQAEVTRIEERMQRFGLTIDDIQALKLHGSTEEMQAAAAQQREMSINTLRAPFDGVITEYKVAVGNVVDPKEHLLSVTDITTVWVLADVYEPDLGRLALGTNAIIRIETYPDRVFSGLATYVSDTIEASTRAAHVRCVVNNHDALLKLGMFARVTLATRERHEALVVPVDALQHVGGQPVVFIQTGETSFERRDVTVGLTANGLVEIINGLEVGESLVARGSFYLKTALLQERIGHSH